MTARNYVRTDLRQLAEVLQENTLYLKETNPEGLGPNAPLSWDMILAERFILNNRVWVWEEAGRLKSVVVARIVSGLFQPVLGAIRGLEIIPAEHESYLYAPLVAAVPQVMAEGITNVLMRYPKSNEKINQSVRGFSQAASRIVDRGDYWEYSTPFNLVEIRAKVGPIITRT